MQVFHVIDTSTGAMVDWFSEPNLPQARDLCDKLNKHGAYSEKITGFAPPKIRRYEIGMQKYVPMLDAQTVSRLLTAQGITQPTLVTVVEDVFLREVSASIAATRNRVNRTLATTTVQAITKAALLELEARKGEPHGL